LRIENRWIGRAARVVVVVMAAFLVIGCDSFSYSRAKDQDTVAAFEAYLDKYAQGRHRIQAEDRIEELVYLAAREEDTVAAYESYRARYPDGKYFVEADDQMDRVAFEAAREEHTVEAYLLYIEKRPEGLYVGEAKESALELRAGESLITESVEVVEKFLADFPDYYLNQEIEGRLAGLAVDRYKSAKDRDQKARLADKVRKYARTVFIDVSVESLSQKPEVAQVYRSDLAARFETAGLVLAKDRESAHLEVKLTAREKKGKTYFDEKQAPIGESVEIEGSIAAVHLVLGETLFDRDISYAPPFSIELTVRGDEVDFQEELYRQAVEEFRSKPYYQYSAPYTKLLLGDQSACEDFYRAAGSHDRSHQRFAKDAFKKGGCEPESDYHKSFLAIADGDKKACLAMAGQCASALCDVILSEPPRMTAGKTPAGFEWLAEMGPDGAGCLCRMVGETLAYDGAVSFVMALTALKKADPEKAVTCMRASIARTPPQWLDLPEYEQEKRRYQRRIETLEKSVEAMTDEGESGE